MPGLVENVLLDSGLAFAAAIQPGPLQAFLVSRVVAGGWKRTLPACIAPLVSDGTMLLTLAAFVFLVGTARFLDPGSRRALAGISALLLARLGVTLLTVAVRESVRLE